MTITYQLEILQQMQRQGFNACNCGNCGGIILFNKEAKEAMEETESGENLICPHCTEEMAYSDCPDLIYEGSPDLEEDRMTSQEKDLHSFLEDNVDHFDIKIDLRGQGDRTNIGEGTLNLCTLTRVGWGGESTSNTFGGISEEFYNKMINKFKL